MIGLHLNFVVARPPKGETPELTPVDEAGLDRMNEFRRTGAGYQEIQGTKPQSLGYGLEDSPAALAAWIVEKFRAWSDCDGDVERSFTKDQLLANVMLYWVDRDRPFGWAPRTIESEQTRGDSCPPSGSRFRWGSPPSRRRSSARPATGPSSATTSATGPTCPEVDTSRLSRRGSC